MALVRSMILVDGENLALRFQAMVDAGWAQKPEVAHEPDVFVWNTEFGITGIPGVGTDVIRVAYYRVPHAWNAAQDRPGR